MVTRKSVRYKVPMNVFYNGAHCPLIDFSRTGAGLNFDKEAPPEGETVELMMVFPHRTGNEGWAVHANVVRVDEEKKFFAVDFVEDQNFKEFVNEFISYMREERQLRQV
ncbi:MAG: PilZ domain-containing protein [Parvibaculales bacterium]